MGIDVFSVGLSGIQSASTRISNSAHNVANMFTEGFHSLKTRQVSTKDGGVVSVTEEEKKAGGVDLPREMIEQKFASLQASGSVQVLKTALDMEKSLVDILA